MPGHQVTGDGPQASSGRTDVQPPAMPHEQLAPQEGLQLTDLPGQRRLSDMQGTRAAENDPVSTTLRK